MKVYISGPISGLERGIAVSNFVNAEILLNEIGLQPVNPINGAYWNKTWKENMVRDIELLMGCDAILMLRNWNESKGARIEKNIAEEMGLKILYESTALCQNGKIKWIKEAIQEATGLRFEQYIVSNRDRNGYFARLIFARQCLTNEVLTIKEVAAAIHRNNSNVQKYMGKYQTELKVNKTFRTIAKHVDEILSKCVSE